MTTLEVMVVLPGLLAEHGQHAACDSKAAKHIDSREHNARCSQPGNDFVRQIVDKVINPFLYDIAGFSVSPDTCKLSYLQQIEYEATASAGTTTRSSQCSTGKRSSTRWPAPNGRPSSRPR